MYQNCARIIENYEIGQNYASLKNSPQIMLSALNHARSGNTGYVAAMCRCGKLSWGVKTCTDLHRLYHKYVQSWDWTNAMVHRGVTRCLDSRFPVTHGVCIHTYIRTIRQLYSTCREWPRGRNVHVLCESSFTFNPTASFLSFFSSPCCLTLQRTIGWISTKTWHTVCFQRSTLNPSQR